MFDLDGDLFMLPDGSGSGSGDFVPVELSNTNNLLPAGFDFSAVDGAADGDVEMRPDNGPYITLSDSEGEEEFWSYLAGADEADEADEELARILSGAPRFDDEGDEVKHDPEASLDEEGQAVMEIVALPTDRARGASFEVSATAAGGGGSALGDSIVAATCWRLHREAVSSALKSGNTAALERALADCAQKYYLSFDQGLLRQESDSEEKCYVLSILRHGTCARRVGIIGHYWLNFEYLNKIWPGGWPAGLEAGINELWADARAFYKKLKKPQVNKIDLPKPKGPVDSAEVKAAAQQWVEYILGCLGQARWAAVAALLRGGSLHKGLLKAVHSLYSDKTGHCLVEAYLMGQPTIEARLTAVKTVLATQLLLLVNVVLNKLIAPKQGTPAAGLFGELGDAEQRDRAERALLAACLAHVNVAIPRKNQLAWAYGLKSVAQVEALWPPADGRSKRVQAFLKGYPAFLASIDLATGQPKRRSGSKRRREESRVLTGKHSGSGAGAGAGAMVPALRIHTGLGGAEDMSPVVPPAAKKARSAPAAGSSALVFLGQGSSVTRKSPEAVSTTGTFEI